MQKELHLITNAVIDFEIEDANSTQKGFSLIELIIVLLIISIISVVSLMSFKGEKKYLADTEAYLIIDLLHEARQYSLTEHQTMRVEFNKTRNTVRLFKENDPGDAADDQEIKYLKLEDPAYVVVGAAPQNVSNYPTESSPVPNLSFKTSVYRQSAGDVVATLRFLENGKVVDAGSNAVGSNAAITGATIYVWMPDSSSSGTTLNTGSVIRALTVLGSTGGVRYLKCPVTENQCTNWSQ